MMMVASLIGISLSLLAFPAIHDSQLPGNIKTVLMTGVLLLDTCMLIFGIMFGCFGCYPSSIKKLSSWLNPAPKIYKILKDLRKKDQSKSRNRKKSRGRSKRRSRKEKSKKKKIKNRETNDLIYSRNY